MPGVKFGKGKKAASPAKAEDGLLALEEGSGGLLPADATWGDLWKGMPAFEMGDTEAYQKVTLHFRDADEVEAFGKLMGIDMTERTSTIWFTQSENYVAPKELIYRSASNPPPRYPIYIPSVGRADDSRTAIALKAIGVPFRVVVEPLQYEKYAASLGSDVLLVLPDDYSLRNTGSIPARNFIFDHAISEGHARHWVIDDNVRGFLRMNRNRRIPVEGSSIFRAAEDFTDRFENVAFSGFNYMYLAPDRGKIAPFYLNTRVYSMILVNNAVPYRWRGRYNEDTDICLRALKDGWATILFNAFLGDKAPTLTMKGGNTDTVYATGDKRLEFARSLEAQHPDVAKVVFRYGRWHHEVNYSSFAGNRLRPKAAEAITTTNEYGMALAREWREARYPTAKAETVTFAPKKTEGPAEPPTPKVPEATVPQSPPPEEKASPKPVQETKTVTQPSSSPPIIFTRPGPPATPKPITTRGESAKAVTLGARTSKVSFAPGAEAPKKSSYTDPFLAFHKETLRLAGRQLIKFDDVKTVDIKTNDFIGLDIEVFKNFFLACFLRFSDGKRFAFEGSSRSKFDSETVKTILTSNRIVTFNGATFDIPILFAAIEAGVDTEKLKEISDTIIREGAKPWEVEKLTGVKVPRVNHIDLMEPNPSVHQGLKTLHARLNGRFVVSLPFDPATRLTAEEMNVVTLYCMNDLDATANLWAAMKEPIDLRTTLSRRYNIDLRSKSDAQVGEAIVKHRAEAKMGRRVGVPSSPTSFSYSIPSFVSFSDPQLVAVVEALRNETFRTGFEGKAELPEWLEKREIKIGSSVYRMGIGGLHSSEAHRGIVADDKYALVDADVASQYPNIILKLGLYPKAIGPVFLDVYRDLVDERLAAKASGNKAMADGGKIAANGVFGKLLSTYSPLYAPELGLATTLTGQLSLLMIIEKAEAAGIPIVSGNTDGVVAYFERSKESEFARVIKEWEAATGFTVETTRYKAIYNASVNSYLALGENGKVKRKGPIADPWGEKDLRTQMSKNPQMTACSEAVLRFVRDAIPFSETIFGLSDPKMFVTVIKVNGGAAWRGAKLGNVVRYYWSKDGDEIRYVNADRKVAKTDGAKPMMELTDLIPEDVDRERYVEEATKLAKDLGALEEEGILK